MNVAVLNPAGWVAVQEKSLMITAFALIMLVVVPVIIMVLAFSFKYRSSNTQAKYLPDWCHNNILEAIWWGIPTIIIIILATITYISTHKLDPYRKLEHEGKPVEIYAIALDWKWLFIIPEYNIASVNHLVVPVNRPLNFTVTADAPMNSFMIPQLGGQIYAMQGMETKIHLIAEKIGIFDGYSSNYSGFGFSGMRFKLESKNDKGFEEWVSYVKNKNNFALTKDTYYAKLLPPTRKHKPEYYSSVEEGLYRHIVEKYMMSHGDMEHAHHHGHHEKQYTREDHLHDVGHVSKYYERTGNHH